jgi:hypothetical protein
MAYLHQIILIVIVIAIASVALRREVRSSPEVVTAGGMFLLLSIVGFLLPAAVVTWTGTIAAAPWAPSLAEDDIGFAVLMFVVAMALFGWGYQFSRRSTSYSGLARQTALPFGPAAEGFRSALLRTKYIYAVLFGSGTIYVASLWLDMRLNNGSWSAYLTAHLIRRWTGEAASRSNWVEWAFHAFGPMMLSVFMTFTLVLFFYREREGKPFFWGIIVPMCCWLLTVTTFFRGSQLGFFTSLLMVEALRRKLSNGSSTSARSILGRRTVLTIALIGLGAFVAYGSVRQAMSSSAWGGEAEVTNAVLTQNVVGILAESHALEGLASILHEYHGDMFFRGGTYIDMLLLPVPRAIYTSKPDWYGIDDITRRMGWPPSTQSGVTMPGEAYANFGWEGMPVMFVFGWLFRLIERLRLKHTTFFAYACWMPIVVPVTFWMSFTGFMTTLVTLPVYLLLVRPAFKDRQADLKCSA